MSESPCIVQIGFVVRNIDASMRHYHKLLGLNHWHIKSVDSDAETNTLFHQNGHEIKTKAKIAWAKLGDVEIELIQPLDTTSIYALHLQEKGPGIHHLMIGGIAFTDMASHFHNHKIAAVVEGEHLGNKLKLFDTKSELGFLCEIAQGGEIEADEIIEL